MGHCRMWFSCSLLGRSQVEGKHLGRLTFTWKERRAERVGKDLGYHGISGPGLDVEAGWQAGRRGSSGAHGDGVIISFLPFPYLSSTRRRFLSLNLCSQCEGLAVGPGMSPPSAVLSGYEGHRLWLHGQLTSFTISQMRCLPNLSLTKREGIIPVFLTVFLFPRTGALIAPPTSFSSSTFSLLSPFLT